MIKKILLAAVLLLCCLGAQAQYFTGFSVKSYKISSVWPTSFRSLKGSVIATIGNTGDTREMSGIHAKVYRNGKPFAEGNCENVTFYKGSSSYTLNGEVSLSAGVSTWDAIGAALSFNVSEYTIDFSVDIRHPDGKVDHVRRTGMPLSHYLRR